MRAALVVNRVTADAAANLAAIRAAVQEAAAAGADLAVFPEAAVTGLINDDDPVHDLPLGQPIAGDLTATLGAMAREAGLWLAIGLLERAGDRLYDSAVLLRPTGEIALHYRRIQPRWHGSRADPAVYSEGTEVAKVDTPLGSIAFAICGDLWDDAIAARLRALQPDWLLYLSARCFDDGSYDQQRWDLCERPEYLARFRLTGCTVLMANYLADRELMGGSFGGALAVAPDGTVLADYPLGQPGMLLVETLTPHRR